MPPAFLAILLCMGWMRRPPFGARSGSRPALLLLPPRSDSGKAPQQDLDMEILLAYLRRGGFSVQMLNDDLSCLGGSRLLGRVETARTCILYARIRRRLDLQILTTILPRLRSCSPEPLVLVGGEFARRYDLQILERFQEIDAVVRGEPELTLEALGESLAKGEPWWKEPGISWRANGAGGQPVRNPPRPLLEDLDQLPMAADDLFEASRLERGQLVLLARGCNNDCLYCGLQTPYRDEFPARNVFWRSRSAASIVDEIEHYHRHKGVTRFILSSFVLFGYEESGGERVTEVAREILRRRLDVSFSFVSHPGALRRNRATLPLLRKAGLAQVILGIDSGLPRSLELYKVPFSLDDIFEALRALHETRTDFLPVFVFYDPYLTPEEIRANLQFLEEIEPFFAHLELPYAYYLEKHMLYSVLAVRQEMPIYTRLLEDELATDVDPLQADPVVRFRSSETGKVFQVHRTVHRRMGQKLRSAVVSAKTIEQFPELKRFHIDLLRKIVELVERRANIDDESAVEESMAWIKGQLPAMLFA